MPWPPSPFALKPVMAFPEMTSLDAPPALSLVCEVPTVPFTVDDRFHSHAKVLALSLAARGLWVSAGSWSSDHGTDGAVPRHVITALGGTHRQVAALVAAGMWGETPEGIEFHDWAFWNSPAAPEVPVPALSAVPESPARTGPPRAAGARRVALQRVPGLKRKLRERDGDLCRYCAREVRWGNGRAPDSGTWDWLEPGGEPSAENVVTACTACARAKAGRSLEDSGMTLLAPPAAGKRNAACNASDLRNPGGNASCNAYTVDGNAYSRKPAGQKRYTDDDQDRSKSSSSSGARQPVPVLDARARKARPGSPEFRRHVIARFHARTGVRISTETADALAAEVLADRKGVTSALAYVLAAIDQEDDPVARWAPELAVQPAERSPERPALPEWCRECDETDRSCIDANGNLYWCPRCSPKSFTAAVALEVRAS